MRKRLFIGPLLLLWVSLGLAFGQDLLAQVPQPGPEGTTKSAKKIPKKKQLKKGDGQATGFTKKPKVKSIPSQTQIETQGAKPESGKIRATQTEPKGKNEEEIVTSFGRKTRIDFEDLLIEGQTKKADTVYLFERTESKINSLVKIRKDFRKEIMESYLE
jgi:hypothetical protein